MFIQHAQSGDDFMSAGWGILVYMSVIPYLRTGYHQQQGVHLLADAPVLERYSTITFNSATPLANFRLNRRMACSRLLWGVLSSTPAVYGQTYARLGCWWLHGTTIACNHHELV